MDGIFGDEGTITANESPDASGQEEQTAGQITEGDDAGFEEQDDFEGGDEQDEQDDEDGESPDSSGQGEELILGKFKSPEDLAKAYQNLQREFTKSRQQPSTTPIQQPPAQPGGQPMDPNSVFWDHFRDNPLGTIQQLVSMATQQQVAPLQQAREDEQLLRNVETLAKQYPKAATDEGMGLLFSKVAEIANEIGNSGLIKSPTPRILRMAAAEAFGESGAKAYEQGKRAGREETAAARRTKQAANLPKGGKKQTEGELSPVEQMKANILAASRGSSIFG
ncbi:hypothetical protein VE23_25235 [Paenibacillus sp. D9]|uniref:hypothetical protein n=1 Tax=Paenibacillus sp. D9 TaxID=665792 RepID=UPI00061E03BE|nr:hypothetical protein [Paenibacillus sp. D9]KKC45828.1 hypothetical protein VE23_25235 [Paenibacillus sp. D9]